MINNLLAAIIIALLFSSCLVHKRGMYLSPLDSQTIPYHTIPFKSDSIKSAIYGSIVYSTGTANDQGQDWVHAGQAYIYRSHNLGNVQAYYGGNFTLGTYGVSNFYNSHYTPGPVDDPQKFTQSEMMDVSTKAD